MIRELSIRDLGVIRQARLTFKPGFNVLTGETGAGKTMVLTALGLLLGERADFGMVRNSASQCVVEGRWQTSNRAVIERVTDAGGLLDGDEVLFARIVSADKSRAMLGGISVPVGLLGEVGNRLVVVHGQADQIRLKSPAAQREALDAFAGLGDLLAEYQLHFLTWRDASSALATFEANRNASAIELEQLKQDLAEFDRIAPREGEDRELSDVIHRLENAEALRLAAATAHESISSESDSMDALGLVETARRALEHEMRNDSGLEQLMLRLASVGFELRDVATELASYLAKLEADEGMSLEGAQQRKAELATLMRKHGPTLDDVFAWHRTSILRSNDLDTSDKRLEALRGEIEKSLKLSLKFASLLSQQRIEAAVELAREVNIELAALAMKDAELVVSVSPAEELGIHGSDLISIQLRSYPGAEPRPLGKGASGGELSRIMLAIEVVLAKDAQTPTFVFDEVDAGIGGAAAIEVGRRLAKLAKTAQVIVVTHLAQVAAFGDCHFTVSKSQSDGITESDVAILEGEQRVAELARMLSGLADSSAARENAVELMSLASEVKSN